MVLRSRRVIPWAILAVALVLRLAWLPLRPPHSDEGVDGWFAEKVLSDGFYHYDPQNYHGPLHYYLLAIARLLFGHNLWALRLPTVLFGLGAVWIALRCARSLGRRVAWGAALFLAVSPALVLYARWAIHESEFLFFSMLVFHGLCRWSRRSSRAALWEIGIGFIGALASKEVWVVHTVALVGAWCVWRWTRRLVGEPWTPSRRPPLSWILPIAAAGIATLALLYSGFGRDPDGIVRFFAPYAIWTTRAMEGAGHEKPWPYWLELFARYEPAALLGLVVAPFAAFAARRPIRPLALYGLASFAAYTVIHYKTPWCVLEIVWPFCFLAAWGLARLAERGWPRLATTVTLGIAAASLVPCIRVNFIRYADPAEPYAYVQTFPEALEPVRLLERAAKRDPSLHDATIHVVMKLSWPLPWLLADFRHVGHWTDTVPPDDAVVVFVDDAHRAQVEATLRRPYFVLPFKLSPAHAQSFAYFDAERFAAVAPPDAQRFAPAPTPPLVEWPRPSASGSTR
jgi:uncharacterized protein (TIGR03663 family)